MANVTISQGKNFSTRLDTRFTIPGSEVVVRKKKRGKTKERDKMHGSAYVSSSPLQKRETQQQQQQYYHYSYSSLSPRSTLSFSQDHYYIVRIVSTYNIINRRKQEEEEEENDNSHCSRRCCSSQ
jgi:hypothetical protein